MKCTKTYNIYWDLGYSILAKITNNSSSCIQKSLEDLSFLSCCMAITLSEYWRKIFESPSLYFVLNRLFEIHHVLTQWFPRFLTKKLKCKGWSNHKIFCGKFKTNFTKLKTCSKEFYQKSSSFPRKVLNLVVGLVVSIFKINLTLNHFLRR